MAVVALAGGCTTAAPEAVTSAIPVTAATAAPGASAVADARQTLGAPMIALAESLLALRATVDTVRHQSPRGTQVMAAVSAVEPLIVEVESATAGADAAAREMGLTEDRPGRAATVVADTAQVAARASADARAELAALSALARLDVEMDGIAAGWDAPGSQSARRAALAALGARADALAERARLEPALPAECPALRDHRVGWARLLAERSRALGSLATGSSGEQYDAQLAAFAALPYGEDRLVADAADRPCWQRSSSLARAAAGVRAQVAALESLLR